MYKSKIIKRNNKAISDIVAVIMLILIAVAASIMIYIWLRNLVGSMHAAPNPILTESIDITLANINYTIIMPGIPGIFYYNVYAYVQNLGSTTVTINSIAVINATNYMTLYEMTFNKSININPGKIGEVWTTLSSKTSIPPGTPVIIQVTTSNGVIATYQTTWPKVVCNPNYFAQKNIYIINVSIKKLNNKGNKYNISIYVKNNEPITITVNNLSIINATNLKLLYSQKLIKQNNITADSIKLISVIINLKRKPISPGTFVIIEIKTTKNIQAFSCPVEWP